MWPAFWMLGNDVSGVGWPACGEIDIMENIGREPNIVHGTIHGPGYSGANGPSMLFASPDGKPFADGYHLYAIEWEQNEIRFYVDDHLYVTRKPSDLPAARAGCSTTTSSSSSTSPSAAPGPAIQTDRRSFRSR